MITKETSYRHILGISIPIMLGSAAQNIIALTDSVFLYHKGENDFAAIGFISVFYLMIAAIGYGFSRGGQIIIARRMGEKDLLSVGKAFYAMLYFEVVLASVMFVFMQWICPYLFHIFLDSEIIYAKSLEYLNYRSYGVFFSYLGVSIIAMYMGIARTTFLIIDTVLLAGVNIFLDYALVFGHYGFPEMGISGAGLASTIAEVVAFVAFVLYMLWDKELRKLGIFNPPKIDYTEIWHSVTLSFPMVLQGFVSIGSWTVFFGIVENLGERELAVSNLVRMVYLIVSIPTWGLAAGVNTLVSSFIGRRKRQAVLPIIWKTSKLSFGISIVLMLPFLIAPTTILYPLLGGSENEYLITAAQPIFYVLTGIIAIFSIGGIYFSGMAGTGATLAGLKIQIICAISYILYVYFEINHTDWGLPMAWAAEILYWVVLLGLVIFYMRSRKWHRLKV